MEYFETVVSQLDHAATQLSQQTALSRRMALILTDNAVELMLHHYASERLEQDLSCGSHEEQAKTRKIRDEVLGHQFVPKVNFARSTDRLAEDEALFTKLAHTFRNEAYHVGVLHEDVITELTWCYYGLACKLFVSVLEYVTWTWGSNCPMLAKHAGVATSSEVGPDDGWGEKIATSLAALRPPLEESFSLTLYKSISKRLRQIRDDVEFILRWDGTIHTNAEVIATAQGFRASQKNAITASTLVRWNRRAEKLKNVDQPGRALQTFTTLGEEIERFEEDIGNWRADVDDRVEEWLREEGLWPPKNERQSRAIMAMLEGKDHKT
jgi:hypothetical protein